MPVSKFFAQPTDPVSGASSSSAGPAPAPADGPAPNPQAAMAEGADADEPRLKQRLKQQYPGIWSHTDKQELKAPKDMTKADFGELLMRCAAEIFRKTLETRRSRLNRLLKACVFAELHESGETHYHFLLLAEYPWSFVPLARTLRAEGICVDFSDGHDYYWTGFVYLSVPGLGPAKKKECDLD